MNKFSLLVLGFLVLSGCSKYVSNTESVYLRSHNAATVDVPAPLTSSNIGHFYDLPQQNQVTTVSIAPPVE